MSLVIRPYNKHKDQKAAHRIWLETGWTSKDKTRAMDLYLESGRALVIDHNGEPECLGISTPGSIRYLKEDLPFSSIPAITTSRIARRQGLASRLTAQLIAEDTLDGALVCGLGMFDQGFYNQLGFGSGCYEHWVMFDPASLDVQAISRPPRRLSQDDWETMHQARLKRIRTHGTIILHPSSITRADMVSDEDNNYFGLGYFDDPNDQLSHYLWGATSNVERGPYNIWWMSYQNAGQFMELLALIKTFGDQVHKVSLEEPPDIQMQDFIQQPFKQFRVTEKSEYAGGIRARAFWQMRICNLAGCLEKTHLPGETVRFNLRLSDPINNYLSKDMPWLGIAGSYIVTLGPVSHAEEGTDNKLPTLTASVGAFTRMWLGVRPASGLAVSDDLAAPEDLLSLLDSILRLPTPKPDWPF